jgi:hypothetical protein
VKLLNAVARTEARSRKVFMAVVATIARRCTVVKPFRGVFVEYSERHNRGPFPLNATD